MKVISGIYKIESKIKPERIYIGSAVNIYIRWTKHLNQLRNNNHHSKKLQRHYNKYGISDLQFSILISCNKEDLIKHEQYFLDSYNTYFNTCKVAGSSLGVKLSEEHKNKIKETFKNKIYSEELKQKFSSFKGKHHSEEIKRKISEGNKGKKLSIETKEKISKSRQGLKTRLGCKLSEETKKKMSDSKKGKVAWNKGIVISDEHRQHIKDSWINRKLKYGKEKRKRRKVV